MCLPAVRSGATRKRTGAVARVGGAPDALAEVADRVLSALAASDAGS